MRYPFRHAFPDPRNWREFSSLFSRWSVWELASPLEGSRWTAPSDVPGRAVATDPDGFVSRVEFLLDGKSVADVSLFEINEAFAAVGIASMAELGISDEIVNVNGGAIALGHPIGMSGNRLALTLLHELRRRGGGLGAAALCGGGGQGDALLVRTV